MSAQLELLHAPIEPTEGSQCARLLEQMCHGERFTVASALTSLHIFALSQRCGELRRMGWPIQSRFVRTSGGANVKEYFIG